MASINSFLTLKLFFAVFTKCHIKLCIWLITEVSCMGWNNRLVSCIFMIKYIRNRTAWINAESKFQYGCHGVNWDTNHGVNWDTFCMGHLLWGQLGHLLYLVGNPAAIKTTDNK